MTQFGGKIIKLNINNEVLDEQIYYFFGRAFSVGVVLAQKKQRLKSKKITMERHRICSKFRSILSFREKIKKQTRRVKIMKKSIEVVAVIMVAAIFTGCATILSGKNRAINVSAQNGEEVKIQAQTKDGVINLKTPSILNVTAANKDIIITVTDPCYKKTQTIVSKKIDGTFWVNVLSGGVCGSTTDSASGAMWTYDPNVIVPTSKKARCK